MVNIGKKHIFPNDLLFGSLKLNFRMNLDSIYSNPFRICLFFVNMDLVNSDLLSLIQDYLVLLRAFHLGFEERGKSCKTEWNSGSYACFGKFIMGFEYSIFMFWKYLWNPWTREVRDTNLRKVWFVLYKPSVNQHLGWI